VDLLKRAPPGDEATARQWFQALSSRASGRIFYVFLFEFVFDYLVVFSYTERQELPEIPFVPVKSTGDKDIIKRLQPTQCFLGTPNSDLYSKLFAFVDFGTDANAFLRACGIRQEPSVGDIAQILVTEPRRAYELASSREK
jgi:Protein of unknown function (DUF3684)